ncbi:MAG: hypothetical protein QM831_14785 [Kofleriaceae bacterium]
MAVSQTLIDQIMKLDDDSRRELLQIVAASLDDGEADDNLDADERERLHAAIARSEAQFAAGRYRKASEVLEALRARRR